jgi:2-polyprenyl-6-methoxyphenol hydroxylase-like FAD-dependent oxidoreductase
MPDCDVVIVGAGVGGLTLGLLLGKKGYRVTIFEKRNSIESLQKPELLQPAGLEVLHTLGVLEKLQTQQVVRCEVFDFFSVQGRFLCRVEYRTLTHHFPYALIAFPHLTQSILLEKLSDNPTVQVRWGCPLSGLVRPSGGPTKVTFRENGKLSSLSASVVIGGDGKNSLVRELSEIQAKHTNYDDAFVTLEVQRYPSFGNTVRYYLGRRQILGMFPVSQNRLCLLYMVPARGFDWLKARGLPELKAEISSVDDMVGSLLSEISDWSQVSYMPCRTVRVSSWVQDGVALIGDAAHACHPHVAQGSTQAMLDALALEPVLTQCLNAGDFSAEKLLVYEKARRSSVEALQRIAHEYAWLWSTGNPLLAWLRDRAFREIGRRPHLLSKVVETEAGLRTSPLTLSERLQALGVFP